jgi:transcriptional regulator with XRE-family HTH domain
VPKLSRLRTVRERRAVTQAELAERARVNVTTISRAEQQAITPHASTVRALAQALDVTPAELMAPEP